VDSGHHHHLLLHPDPCLRLLPLRPPRHHPRRRYQSLMILLRAVHLQRVPVSVHGL
jgi:hypothetical protein